MRHGFGTLTPQQLKDAFMKHGCAPVVYRKTGMPYLARLLRRAPTGHWLVLCENGREDFHVHRDWFDLSELSLEEPVGWPEGALPESGPELDEWILFRLDMNYGRLEMEHVPTGRLVNVETAGAKSDDGTRRWMVTCRLPGGGYTTECVPADELRWPKKEV